MRLKIGIKNENERSTVWDIIKAKCLSVAYLKLISDLRNGNTFQFRILLTAASLPCS